jgi:uncharacterized protein (UPF0335 family)
MTDTARESVAYLLRAYQERIEQLEQDILDLELELEEEKERCVSTSAG